MVKWMFRNAWRVSLIGLLIAVGCGDRNDRANQSPSLEAPPPPPAADSAGSTETPSGTASESGSRESPDKPKS